MERQTPPVLELSATELSRRIHARQISCRELMVATLAQVDALNPEFNAIVSRGCTQALLVQAEQYDREVDAGQSRPQSDLAVLQIAAAYEVRAADILERQPGVLGQPAAPVS